MDIIQKIFQFFFNSNANVNSGVNQSFQENFDDVLSSILGEIFGKGVSAEDIRKILGKFKFDERGNIPDDLIAYLLNLIKGNNIDVNGLKFPDVNTGDNSEKQVDKNGESVSVEDGAYIFVDFYNLSNSLKFVGVNGGNIDNGVQEYNYVNVDEVQEDKYMVQNFVLNSKVSLKSSEILKASQEIEGKVEMNPETLENRFIEKNKNENGGEIKLSQSDNGDKSENIRQNLLSQEKLKSDTLTSSNSSNNISDSLKSSKDGVNFGTQSLKNQTESIISKIKDSAVHENSFRLDRRFLSVNNSENQIDLSGKGENISSSVRVADVESGFRKFDSDGIQSSSVDGAQDKLSDKIENKIEKEIRFKASQDNIKAGDNSRFSEDKFLSSDYGGNEKGSLKDFIVGKESSSYYHFHQQFSEKISAKDLSLSSKGAENLNSADISEKVQKFKEILLDSVQLSVNSHNKRAVVEANIFGSRVTLDVAVDSRNVSVVISTPDSALRSEISKNFDNFRRFLEESNFNLMRFDVGGGEANANAWQNGEFARNLADMYNSNQSRFFYISSEQEKVSAGILFVNSKGRLNIIA